MYTSKTCAVLGCSRTSETPGIAFFNFPRRKQEFHQWIRFAQKAIIYDMANTYICSAHFSSEDFVDDKRECLKETAVPSLVDQETLDVCVADDDYPNSCTEEVETVVIQDDIDLNNIEIKYIKEEEVEYTEEEVEYAEEPYFEVEIQDEPIFTEPEEEEDLDENTESNSYHDKNDEIMEMNVPNQLIINEDTIVEINETGLIDESTVVEIAEPIQQTKESTIVEIKEPNELVDRPRIVKICRAPDKKIIELSNAQIVTPVTVTFQLCRFCTKQIERDGIDIFTEDETSIQISEMLKVVIPGKVKEDDGLPNVMCESCVDKLKQCYDIMIMFFAADAYFRNKEFITLPRPSDQKDNNFQDEEMEEILKEEHVALDENDLSNAIIIENSDDLEEVIIFNEMEKMQTTSYKNEVNSKEMIIENSEKHVCSLCSKSFDTLTSLILHNYSKHVEVSNKGHYTCPKCPMVFSMLQALKLHVQRKHPNENKLYVCGECKLGFKHKHMLDNHKKNNHKKHMCDICGKSFLFAVSLQRHMERHNNNFEETQDGNKAHLCWICGKAYSVKQNLHNHIQVHFGIQVQGYPCLVCGRKLESVSELRIHLGTHKEREKNFNCSKCNKTYLTKSLLQRHYLTHSSERLYMCEICGKAFKKSSTLNRHISIHTNVKDESEQEHTMNSTNSRNNIMDLDIYECETCGKKIVSKLSYKYHVAKHTGNKKPFDCEVCGLTFAKVQGYRTHLLFHRGEFPYVCDKCGKGFRTKRTLQQHEVVHTDERPYSCNHCHLAFKRMDSLYMHQAVHSGKRPFSCTMCGKTFVRKQDTRTHLIRYHKMHNSEVDLYIVKEIENENESNDNSNFQFAQEDYFTEYITVGNSLEVETT